MDILRSAEEDTFFSYDEVAAKDEFERHLFSDRLTRLIIDEPGGKPLVISIVNPWGGGKSTILQYVRDAIAATTRDESPHIKNCRITTFNPWRYAGEDSLLYHLFEHLVTAINQKTPLTTAQAILKLLPKWMKRAALVCDWLAPGTGALLEGFFATISPQQFEVHLDAVRQTTREHLAKTGIRVIMLLDDVDRLDPDEIMLLFRALKLITDLPNTTFIIAMDEEHVSEVIGKRIGGSIESGRRYIEKIVNVRLAVPKIPDDVLEDYVLKRFITIWRRERGEAPPMEVERMSKIFRALHLPFILTPRTVKSIENAFAFALGLLPDEVDAGDVLLLEATRLLHPKLYLALPEVIPNQNKYLPSFIESMLYADTFENKTQEENEKIVRKLIKLISTSSFRPKNQIEEALTSWFPQLGNSYSRDDEDKNEQAKHICSPNYFWRYYSGAVHKKDIHDAEVSSWLALALDPEKNDLACAKLQQHLNQPYLYAFLSKLTNLLIAKSENSILPLTLITKIASGFAPDTDMASSGNLWQKTASVISTVIQKVPDIEKQIEMATKVVQASKSLEWSFVFFDYLPGDYLTKRAQEDNEKPTPSKLDEELAGQCLDAYENHAAPEHNALICKMVWTIYRNIHLEKLQDRVQKIVKSPAVGLQFLVGGCAFGPAESHRPACWRWLGAKGLSDIEKLIPMTTLKQILKALPEKAQGFKLSAGDHEYLTLEEVGWACLESIEKREVKKNPARDG